MSPMLGKGSVGRTLIHAGLAAYSLVIILPFFWMFAASFKTTREIFADPFGWPEGLSLANYARAWDQGIGAYFLNSLLVTAVTVILIIVLSGLAAYGFARLRFRGRTLLYALIIAGYAVPIHTVLVPLYKMLDAGGMLDSYAGLILPYVAFGIPFSIILLYAFLLEFPKELEEAARLDGCNRWQTIRHVVAPLSLPGISSVAIFMGVFTWNEFLLGLLILSSDDLKTLPVGLAAFQGAYGSDWGALMAGVVLATLPLLVLYMALQKHFVRSLAGLGK